MTDEKPSPEAPEETPINERVLLVPGHFFFIESVPVPEDLDAGEIEGFAELNLESIAPFPVEQLRWGFFHTPGAPALLLFAALEERLKREGFKDLEAYAWVLPDFAGPALAEYTADTEVLHRGESSLALLHAAPGGAPPSVLLAAPAPEDPAEDEAAFERLRRQAPERPLYSGVLLLRPAGVETDERGRPVFHHLAADATLDEHSEPAPRPPARPPADRLWHADLRPLPFKRAERAARRLSRGVSRATTWAALFALLLALLELVLLGGRAWLENRQAKIESRSAMVRRVEDQQSLMQKLRQVAQNELRPIAMLEIANRIRLDLQADIVYDTVEIEGENRLTVEGEAGSVNEFNNYIDRLRRSGSFQVVGEPKYLTRGGQTTFSVTLHYEHDTAAAETAEAPAEAAAPTP